MGKTHHILFSLMPDSPIATVEFEEQCYEEEVHAPRKRGSCRTCLPIPNHGNEINCLFYLQRKSNMPSKMITYCVSKYRLLTCHQKSHNHVVGDFHYFSKHMMN